MNQKYKEALSEVEFVLSRFDASDVAKIPQTFRSFITENKCKWHEVNEDTELSEETLSVLAIIYRKFLAPPEERAELERKFQEKLKQETEELKRIEEESKKSAPAEINYNFAQPAIVKKVEEPHNVQMVDYKNEKWYMKLIEKIKGYFKK